MKTGKIVNGIYPYQKRDGWYWGIDILVNYEKVRLSGFESEKAALRKIQRIRGEQYEGSFYPDRHKQFRIREFAGTLLEKYEPIKPDPWSDATEREKKRYWNQFKFYSFWKDALKNVQIYQLHGDDGERKIRGILKRLDDKNPNTYNHYLNWAKKVFRPEHLKGNIPANPFGLIKIKKAPPPKDAYYTEKQIRALFKKLSYRDRLITMLDLISGMRRSELFTTKKEWINLKWGVIKIPNSKTGRDRIIVLTKQAIRLPQELIKLSDPDNSYLIPSPRLKNRPLSADTWYMDYFREARIAAKIPDTHTFHTLRHTFSTWQNEQKVDLLITQRSGGWAKKEMMAGYTHQEVDRIREALELTFSHLQLPKGS